MARARNIKPGFFRNADLVELQIYSRMLFIGLWTIADRDGRLEDRPKQIKMEIFPADSVDCDAMLDELASTGMVERYTVDGKRYLQVVNFAKHQNPHRDEKASTLPDINGHIAESEPKQTKHRANTVQAPCNVDAGTVAIGLNPDPRSLIPDSLIPDSKGEVVVIGESGAGEDPPPPKKTGAICMVLKSEGISFVNPSHPALAALIDAGAEVGHFAEVAKYCVERKKPDFAYVLAVVKGQMADAAAQASEVQSVTARASRPQPQSFATQDAIRGMLRWEEMTGEIHPDWHTVGGRPSPKTTVDMGMAIEADGPAPKRIAA